MEKFAGATADQPEESADNMDNINEEDVDHSQSAPTDDDPGNDGPSVADAFRAGT